MLTIAPALEGLTYSKQRILTTVLRGTLVIICFSDKKGGTKVKLGKQANRHQRSSNPRLARYGQVVLSPGSFNGGTCS